jgi:hypothetical protein
VGFFFTPDGKIFVYKIKARGSKYFVKNNNNVKGIFTLNNKYRKTMGKTSVYFFATQETNAIDLQLIDKLNRWKRKNSLTEIKRKDVKHGAKLRTLLKQKEKIAIDVLKKEESEKSNAIKGEVDAVEGNINKRLDELRNQHNKEIVTTNAEKGIMLLAHLLEIKMIDDVEYAKYLDKVERNTYTFDMLLDEMREKYDVQVSEPLDITVEDFIQDLGAQSASELAGFVQDLKQNKRGLKDLTPAPVKSFIPAGILLALMIGIPIAIVILAPYLGGGNLMGGGAPAEGGLKMPWDMFGGFIMGLFR